jgi:hypothetical protein
MTRSAKVATASVVLLSVALVTHVSNLGHLARNNQKREKPSGSE